MLDDKRSGDHHADPQKKAEVAELADALDSKSSVPKGRVGSSPTFGILRKGLTMIHRKSFFVL